jgi:hypothetical protein
MLLGLFVTHSDVSKARCLTSITTHSIKKVVHGSDTFVLCTNLMLGFFVIHSECFLKQGVLLALLHIHWGTLPTQNIDYNVFVVRPFPSYSRKPTLFGLVVPDLHEAWQSVSTILRLKLRLHQPQPTITKTIWAFRESLCDVSHIFFVPKLWVSEGVIVKIPPSLRKWFHGFRHLCALY